MTLSKTLSVLFLASSLAAVGCKKKEEAAPAPTAAAPAAGATKPADTAAAPAAPAAATPPAAPSGNAMFASDDDYVAKTSAAMDKMTEVFKGAGTDCDKLAADITKFGDENKAMMVAAEDYSKTHPDAKKKFDDATKTKMTAFEAVANPAMTACKDNKKVAEAMTKLSPD
jgi:hypothetical protein